MKKSENAYFSIFAKHYYALNLLVKNLLIAYHYIVYRFKSTTEHGVHSPFVFDLLTNVIYNKSDFYVYKKIETLREALLESKQIIIVKDLGAGSPFQKSNAKKIKNIARNAAKSAKYAQLLFRLADHFQPSSVLELGTSLGISTAYLAAANSKIKIISIEGCSETAKIASQNFEKLELHNIEQIIGNFDDVLPTIVSQQNKIDFVLFDGNHRKKPTLDYFQKCLEKSTENSVFVFDDINWSDDMREAWEEIKNNDKVTVTIDLFFMGLVFFRKEQAKQHFIIKF